MSMAKKCTRDIRNIRTLCRYWLQPAAQLAWDLQIKAKNLKGRRRYTFSNAATYPLFGLNDSFTDSRPLPPKYNPRFTTFSELYVFIGDLIETLRAESTLNPKGELVEMYMKELARKTDNTNSILPILPLSLVKKRDNLVKKKRQRDEEQGGSLANKKRKSEDVGIDKKNPLVEVKYYLLTSYKVRLMSLLHWQKPGEPIGH